MKCICNWLEEVQNLKGICFFLLILVQLLSLAQGFEEVYNTKVSALFFFFMRLEFYKSRETIIQIQTNVSVKF